MTTPDHNLAALRSTLAGEKLDAIIIGREGAFACEETQAHEERLAWLTGFSGSAGLAVVTKTEAVLFSDGRYALQMQHQTSDAWECCDYGDRGLWRAVAEWLAGHIKNAGKAGRVARVGYDGLCMVVTARQILADALAKTNAGIDLLMMAHNPIDALWDAKQRPVAPSTKAWDVASQHHGLARSEKMAVVAAEVKQAGGDALLITDPCELAWLLNIRGRDLRHTPVVCAYGLLLADCDSAPSLILFHHKPEAALAEINKRGITLAPSAALLPALAKLTKNKKRVWCDPQKCAVAFYQALAKPITRESPIVMHKAQKNKNEAEGFRAAHKQDALAVMRFLYWLGGQDPLPSEAEAAQHMTALREEGEGYICDSFAAISASGSNGAIIHYQARAESDRKIARHALYLLDSGGHYHRGTTDITRTIYVGNASDTAKAMHTYRHAYTHVLKSHIALATQTFPHGTTGAQLDGVARSPLWQVGLDYPHGTGHGVGACLSVHEGPVGIAKYSTRPLQAGLVLSNEPGVYVAGKFGIRLENLMLVVRHPKDRNLLQFETLTQVPFDRQLIDRQLLTERERQWLNNYHSQIHQQFAAPLAAYDKADAHSNNNGETLSAWLARATAPI